MSYLNFKCRNCGWGHGIMVMTGNNRPACECQGCGYLEITEPGAADFVKLTEMRDLTPPRAAIEIRMREKQIAYEQFQKLEYEAYHSQAAELNNLIALYKEKNPDWFKPVIEVRPKPGFSFKDGQIVQCIEGFNKLVFPGYHYMVDSYNRGAGLVAVRNLRTMKLIHPGISETRFRPGELSPKEMDALIAMGVKKNWAWIEQFHKDLQKPPAPKPIEKPKRLLAPLPASALRRWPTHPGASPILLNEWSFDDVSE